MSHDLTIPALPSLDIPASIKGSVTAGAVIVAVAFAGFGGWAAMAPLDSAVIAHGQLAVESSRKTIQHREGGIVKAILVHDGDRVTAGQILLRLDDAKAEATLEELTGQLDAAQADQGRLIAARDGLPDIVFPAAWTDAGHQALQAAARNQLDESRQRQAAEIGGLLQRAAALRAEVAGNRLQQDSLRRQIALSSHELVGLKGLADKGWYPKNRVIGLERDIARLDGELATSAATQAKTERTIEEIAMQRQETGHRTREQQAKDLDQAQNRIAELRQQVTAAADAVNRLTVVSPVAGSVQNLKLATAGGVITAGMELMEVVPGDDRLVVEARVQANDIEGVEPAAEAELRFSALKGRNAPVLTGKVATVSADRLVDQRTGQPYYETRLEVPADQLARLGGRRIQAGMPVEVMIKSGERSALDYLLRPLMDSFAASFRER
ncbi:MAG TPA: HlyD family type I secretion periplasmic adaptor subunit [Rhodospirillaceae bacterium]|nr:HlyD family type I secretion periplasmic adaptor subunit [Rhodospirillaceae bacterium]